MEKISGLTELIVYGAIVWLNFNKYLLLGSHIIKFIVQVTLAGATLQSAHEST